MSQSGWCTNWKCHLSSPVFNHTDQAFSKKDYFPACAAIEVSCRRFNRQIDQP